MWRGEGKHSGGEESRAWGEAGGAGQTVLGWGAQWVWSLWHSVTVGIPLGDTEERGRKAVSDRPASLALTRHFSTHKAGVLGSGVTAESGFKSPGAYGFCFLSIITMCDNLILSSICLQSPFPCLGHSQASVPGGRGPLSRLLYVSHVSRKSAEHD